MKDRIEKLKSLLRLRHREVERRTLDATAAARQLAEAEAGCARAENARSEALADHETALARRLDAPGDLLIGVYCRATEIALEEAQAALAAARTILAEASARAAEIRRLLLRAHARFDSLDALLRRTVARHRTTIDLRMMDDHGPGARPAHALVPA